MPQVQISIHILSKKTDTSQKYTFRLMFWVSKKVFLTGQVPNTPCALGFEDRKRYLQLSDSIL